MIVISSETQESHGNTLWTEYSSFWCIKQPVYLKGLIQLTQPKPNINGSILILSYHLCVGLSATVPHALKVISLFKKAPNRVQYVALHGTYWNKIFSNNIQEHSQNWEERLLVSSCLPVRMNISAHTRRIFVKFCIWGFIETVSGKSKFDWNLTRITGTPWRLMSH